MPLLGQLGLHEECEGMIHIRERSPVQRFGTSAPDPHSRQVLRVRQHGLGKGVRDERAVARRVVRQQRLEVGHALALRGPNAVDGTGPCADPGTARTQAGHKVDLGEVARPGGPARVDPLE